MGLSASFCRAAVVLLPLVGCHRELPPAAATDTGAFSAEAEWACRSGLVLEPSRGLEPDRAIGWDMLPIQLTWSEGIAEVETEGVTHRFVRQRGSERARYERVGADGSHSAALMDVSPNVVFLRDDGDLWVGTVNRGMRLARTTARGLTPSVYLDGEGYGRRSRHG